MHEEKSDFTCSCYLPTLPLGLPFRVLWFVSIEFSDTQSQSTILLRLDSRGSTAPLGLTHSVSKLLVLGVGLLSLSLPIAVIAS